jgi:hypothetical protein
LRIPVEIAELARGVVVGPAQKTARLGVPDEASLCAPGCWEANLGALGSALIFAIEQ